MARNVVSLARRQRGARRAVCRPVSERHSCVEPRGAASPYCLFGVFIECGRCVGTLSGGTRGRGAATASRGRAQTADQGRRYGAGLPHCLLSQNFCVSSCCPRKFANLLIHYEQGACMCTHRLRMRAWASMTVRGSCTTKLQRLRVCLCATGTVCFPILHVHLCHIVHFHLLFLFVFAY